MFLYNRHRRLRKNESIRSMIRENHLSPNDFILPIFMAEGEGVKEEIAAMPGIYRQSLDNTVKEVKEIWDLGIKSVNIYCKVSDNLKDNTGKEAWNPNGLMQNTIKAIKDAVPEMIVMPDVALDPYSVYGHDGIIKNGEVINDETVD
ncbi:MAG: porphobilinogen synthase, partial [Empedobacter falsenii]